MTRRLTLLWLLVAVLPAFAQEDELPPDEVADLVDRYIDRGAESLREGNYEEARLRFSKALRRDPKRPEAYLGIAAAQRALGAYDQADKTLAALEREIPENRAGKTARARIDLVRGRSAEAAHLADEVLAAKKVPRPDLVGLRARIVKARALVVRGRREAARSVLDFFAEYYDRRSEVFAKAMQDADELRQRPSRARPLSEEMTLVARALRMDVELSPLDIDFANNASELLGVARELDGENWEAWIEWVRLTRVERERAIAKARKARAIVTKRNPELADLYVEVARSLLTGFGSAEARRAAETALRINPHHPGAHAIVARVMLEDNEYAGAAEHIDAGLATNPYDRDLLALRATARLLRGDREGFEKGIREMLRVDPTYGAGFHLAGLIVASRQRRYDRAVALVRRGLALSPADFQAQATLGIFLANLGRAAEARAALEKSQELLPYSHPIRDNFIQVLDYVLKTMTEMRTEHFVIRFDPSEYRIASLYLPELLESCWRDLVKRYGFTPKAPVLVECFRKADDFSVRTLGLPGIPALGACFGGLITLDSSQALPEGAFLWASTARHEFGHVISLQLSRGQVPRWFTEGLSVLEEQPLDVGWGKDERFERQVFDAYRTGALPKVATFDAMFRGPRVAFAYYVGGWMLKFLKERSGEKGIVKALRLFGEDRPMEEVFQEAFGLGLDGFDSAFSAFIGKRVARYKLVPDYGPVLARLRRRLLDVPEDAETLLKVAWAYFSRRAYVDAGDYLDRAKKKLDPKRPLVLLLSARLLRHAGRHDQARKLLESYFAAGGESYGARMLLASYYAGAGQEKERDFETCLRKAKKDWPLHATGSNPYTLLRNLAQGRGDRDGALKELEEQAAVLSKNVGIRLALARDYAFRGRDADAIRVLEEALRITLFDLRIHQALLPLYRKAGLRKKAIREARCEVALPVEQDTALGKANRRLDLAEALLDDGQIQEARSALAEAKKLAKGEAMPRIAEVEKRLGQA